MRPKRKYLQEKVFSNVVNQVGPVSNMTEDHYNCLRTNIKFIESPGFPYKKRVRVYYKGGMTESTTIKKYFGNSIKRVDYDRGKQRDEFICYDETQRDALANVLKQIIEGNPGTVPVTNPDNPDPNPDPDPNPGDSGGGSGYYDPETGEYVEEKKSNMTTYLVIAGIVVLMAIVIIKKIF